MALSKQLFLILGAISLFASCAQQSTQRIEPPPGFRSILQSEYPQAWLVVSDQFPTPDRATGDFDGDGLQDQARLWIRDGSDGWMLMAYLSSLAGTPIKITESAGNPWRRPIRAIRAGDHRLHSYYGIGTGKADSTAVVHLRNDAINLAYLESEGVTFVWNIQKEMFESVAMY